MSQIIRNNILARHVDDQHAPDYDLIITWAASLPKDCLPRLDQWLGKGCPTGSYDSPTPSYMLHFDWTDVKLEDSVEVVNRAMERAFGMRGVAGWEIWVGGDQLNLLLRDFRQEYVRLKKLEHGQLAVLDLWVEKLLAELKRM
jgi:hypothetical protein